MNSPRLLTSYEHCNRAGYWSRSWERAKLDETEMLQAAIRAGVTEATRTDWGEVAGEEAYALGIEPGLDTTHYDIHAEVVHIACLADIITTAIRKPLEGPWKTPEPVALENGILWNSGAYLDPSGDHLRRVVLASAWSDDRHYSQCRSWQSLGEVCVYGLPMQMAVIVLGQHRGGKRYSAWTKGLRHPINKKLRFRKKNDKSEGFKSSWLEVWREDYDDISTAAWLQGMLDDGVLQDLCFSVEIPVPEKDARERIVKMAARKLEKIQNLGTLPDPQLSTCDWPKPCNFRGPCHDGRQPKEGVYRFF